MYMLATTKRWTLEELHSLPDDGNKYELIRGVLFVTPAPTPPHETIAARLRRILDPYVALHNLGYVYSPRAVLQHDGSEVEPDLMVRQPHADATSMDWSIAATPSLIIEISSRSTWRRDRMEKRSLYAEARVPEYWIVDGQARAITVVKTGREDVVMTQAMEWHPEGATGPLRFKLDEVFGLNEVADRAHPDS